ncbi:MAG TPA: enoyl-CoA hydratase/isomerase family protein [Trebonia sp.]|nr:enoyl-CoA hydratase/isomerase family protein [Trebonia sp.]
MSSQDGSAAGQPSVRVTSDGPVTAVTIGNGARYNVLGSRDWTALEQAFGELAADERVRVVLLAGQGSSFSAGFNLREWEGASRDEVDQAFARMEAACTAIERLPVPVVAKVRGVAAGAGCQLALACDLRVADRAARLGMPVARLGILTSPSFAARLSLLAGPGVARDLLYTGRLIDALEAQRFGLVTRCVPGSELDQVTAALVESIAAQPPAAIRAAKRAVGAGLGPAIEAAQHAAGGSAVAYGEFQHSVTAFLHGRQPETPHPDN